MAEESSAAQPAPASNLFPVALYDGEKEINSGNITIRSDLLYNEFQIKLGELIGVSYNEVTTYLVDNKKNITPPYTGHELITDSVNFDAIAKEQNCYFLAVLKNSRKSREIHKKRYNYNDKSNGSGSSSNMIGFPSIQEAYVSVDRSLCSFCTIAQSQGKIKADGFHCCVYDAVRRV